MFFPSSSVFSQWFYVHTLRINFKPAHKSLNAFISWVIIEAWESRLCQRVFPRRWHFLKSCQEKSYGGPWMLCWHYSSCHTGWNAEWQLRRSYSTTSNFWRKNKSWCSFLKTPGLFFQAIPIWDNTRWIGFLIPTHPYSSQRGTWHVGLTSSRPRSFSDGFELKSMKLDMKFPLH